MTILRNAQQDLLQSQETLQEEEALARQHQQDTQRYADDCRRNLETYEVSQAQAETYMMKNMAELQQQLDTQRAINAQPANDAAKFDKDLTAALIAKSQEFSMPHPPTAAVSLPPPVEKTGNINPPNRTRPFPQNQRK